MPKSSLRYTLAYAFESPGGVSIVDAGWNADLAWDGLVDGLAAAGFKPGHVRALIATHVHADHYGLADRVRQASGARIALHHADAATISGGPGPARDDLTAARRELGRRIGAPTAPAAKRGPGRDRRDGGTRRDGRTQLDGTDGQARRYKAQIRPDVLIEDGDQVELPGWNLQAIWTPGHSPGHVCYYEQDLGLLLAGDHVLPRITPNISVSTSQQVNPLGDYLASLAAIGDLPVTEVLPAHQYRFHGLRRRVDELAAHHEVRLGQIEAVVGGSQGATCWEIAGQLDWARPFESLPPRLKRAAARETLAHLVLLQLRGRLRGDGGPPERWY
jgi:glyoxylase-like metal-dependent hydrolase (beta-lactamase superfamily II)